MRTAAVCLAFGAALRTSLAFHMSESLKALPPTREQEEDSWFTNGDTVYKPLGYFDQVHEDPFNQVPHDRVDPCAKQWTPWPCKNPEERNFSSQLVVSTYLEDIKWINEINWTGDALNGDLPITIYSHNRTSKRSHNNNNKKFDNTKAAKVSFQEVVDKNPERANPVQFVEIPNKGDEASAYLSYIITKYNKLPDVTFFVQGHRCAEHAPFDMARALIKVQQCFNYELGYHDLNDYNKRTGPPALRCREKEDLLKHPITGYNIEDLAGIWKNYFQEELGNMPDIMCWDPYAQFAVRKELIRQHPVSFYKKLLHGVMSGDTTMEFFWKMVFLKGARRSKDHSKENFARLQDYILNRH